MNSFKNKLSGLALIVSLAALSGCGGVSDQPELGKVTGVVTVNGEPLKGVAVVFSPTDGRPARGMTDETGKYTLVYIRDTLGAKVGINRVEIAPDEEGGDDDDGSAGEDTSSLNKRPTRSARVKIPARYNTKSELSADVKPGENTFDFKLEVPEAR